MGSLSFLKLRLYDKILGMKINKFQVATLAILGISVAYAIKNAKRAQHRFDTFQADGLARIREFFSEMGDIDVVYINQESSNVQVLTGGVVMSDGKIYHFCYRDGQIEYKEEKS